MSTRRLYYALGAIALAAVLTLAGRTALRPGASQGMDSLAFPPRPHLLAVQSAAQSRQALSREIEALENAPVDSATRSYMAWAKAIADEQNSRIDSATRSYMAWAKAVADQRNTGIDSATRSYMAWAKAIEDQRFAAAPTTAP
ncbi:MAG: hypothetical protein ACM3MF_07675 [Anaerolineae bacterium]